VLPALCKGFHNGANLLFQIRVNPRGVYALPRSWVTSLDRFVNLAALFTGVKTYDGQFLGGLYSPRAALK
jgi:hypothetical protein